MASGVLPEASPVQLVEAAAHAGFDYGGMWLEQPEWTAQTTREVRAALRETGLALIDVEFIWLKPEASDADHRRKIDIGKELGARNILCVSSDPDAGATRDKLAALAEHAGRDIRIALEFALFTEVKTVRDACALLREIDHPALSVLIDALHLHRSGGTLEDVAAVPPAWLSYAQLCDASDVPAGTDVEALLDEATHDRLPLGAGALPIGGLLKLFPPGIPLAIEERSRPLRESFPDLNARAVELMRTSRVWLDSQMVS